MVVPPGETVVLTTGLLDVGVVEMVNALRGDELIS
jgi:hypothetical protein